MSRRLILKPIKNLSRKSERRTKNISPTMKFQSGVKIRIHTIAAGLLNVKAGLYSLLPTKFLKKSIKDIQMKVQDKYKYSDLKFLKGKKIHDGLIVRIYVETAESGNLVYGIEHKNFSEEILLTKDSAETLANIIETL